MTLGAAVVGLGVGEQHARAYARDRRARLRWVHDIDRARATRLAAELGAHVAGSLGEILADPDTQLVSIASYDQDHAGQVLATLEAGKHCFVEKPLCRTSAELEAIVTKWTAARRTVLRSNLVLRGAPLFLWLRDAIRDGELGEIYAFDGDYLYGRVHKVIDGWRGEVEGYSVLEGGGIHLLDLLLWLTDQRPSHVITVGNRIVT